MMQMVGQVQLQYIGRLSSFNIVLWYMDTQVQKVLHHEDIDKFEDNLGKWYDTIEDVVRQNEELFEDVDIEYLIQSWTAKPPKRITFIRPLHWEYEI